MVCKNSLLFSSISVSISSSWAIGMNSISFRLEELDAILLLLNVAVLEFCFLSSSKCLLFQLGGSFGFILQSGRSIGSVAVNRSDVQVVESLRLEYDND
ncbi:hypothetical protein CDAR_66571 [Caerostris darwini]|uniref:Uncharacterized protein n=1 Tax=Caerostris darwini TaxID=1538125 RepID=A0AAV4WYK9_9ARAC|nr:hypothetical protein CDAR_66571 [Caerostris darwini]